MKNAFRSASSIHHKKVLVLRCKVLVLVLNTRLGLGRDETHGATYGETLQVCKKLYYSNNTIKKTQLSLTNRVTHLCECNGVADL